jgi:hypothetical protein
MGLKPKKMKNSFTGNITLVKKAIISFDKRPHFFSINTFGMMRHEFFDKVPNQRNRGYVDHLAAANFDPSFYKSRKRNSKQFINQFVGANTIT